LTRPRRCILFMALLLYPWARAFAHQEQKADQEAQTEPNEGRIRLLGHRFSLGLGVGFLSLDSTAARDTFGSPHWHPNIRLVGPLGSKGVRLSISPVWERFNNGETRSQILAPTAGISFNLSHPTKSVVPFGALRTGPYFVSAPGNPTALRAGFDAELGLAVRRRIFFTVSHQLVGHVRGFNLSNWSLNTVFRVY